MKASQQLMIKKYAFFTKRSDKRNASLLKLTSFTREPKIGAQMLILKISRSSTVVNLNTGKLHKSTQGSILATN